MSLRHLTVLGSTGSIGVSTLDVVRRHPERYRVVALCAHRQVDRLFEQCIEFHPRYAVVRDADLAAALRDRLQDAGCNTEIGWGEAALERMSALPEVDTVMAAIVGAAGLKPALAAAQSGKRVLLANKEALVMAGAVFMRAVRENNAVLLPIDSEHNAIFQSLPVDYSGDLSRSGVTKILLTASGGPFRSADRAKLEHVTPDQACAHPNWVMGRKISVDSATLMNKGLEVIEAHWLFNVPPERIQVVVHPQSVIHSMVEYIDGSVLAELGTPDMRTPIAHALAYPERIASGVASLDLFKIASLSFEPPDFERFPCLGLAYEALRTGGTAPAILNAANEIAVAAFLAEEIRFTEIPKIIGATMRGVPVSTAAALEDVLAADAGARDYARQICRQAGDL